MFVTAWGWIGMFSNRIIPKYSIIEEEVYALRVWWKKIENLKQIL